MAAAAIGRRITLAAALTLLAASPPAFARAPAPAPAATFAGEAAAPPAAGACDLDAVVRHGTRQRLASGVERIERWSERLVRRGDTVWTERLGLAADTVAHGAEAAGGHRHFDPETAARLLTKDANGQTRLRYLDTVHRQVVSVPQAEWETVGFDGRHDAAAHLVPPSLVARMPLEPGTAAAAGGARWHVQHAGGWTHRVLWSARRQVALRIESRSDDGRASRTVSVQPRPPLPSAALPWRAVDGWTQREYGDFMD